MTPFTLANSSLLGRYVYVWGDSKAGFGSMVQWTWGAALWLISRRDGKHQRVPPNPAERSSRTMTPPMPRARLRRTCYSERRFDADRRTNPLRSHDSGGVNGNRKLHTFDNRKSDTPDLRSYPQTRCWGCRARCSCGLPACCKAVSTGLVPAVMVMPCWLCRIGLERSRSEFPAWRKQRR